MGGTLNSADAKSADIKGKAVVVVLDYGKPLQPEVQQTIVSLYEAGAAGVVILSNRDSAAFAQRVAAQTRQVSLGVEGLGNQVPVVEVHERALGAVIAALGIKPDEIRGAQSMKVQPLPNLRVTFRIKNEILDSSSAPNTIGILEGSDPELSKEYVVFSAHMDHIGISSRPGRQHQQRRRRRRLRHGGRDGTGRGVQPEGGRPKRSMIFLTVSGEEKGLWGSAYFTEHPPVPLDQIVADLNIDMIGRNWKDTIVAIGKEHSDLGATLERVDAAHPELDMAADRRPVARGELLLPVRPLQFRPEGRADPVLLQRAARGLPPAERFARQDRRREGIPDPPAAVLPRPGRRERSPSRPKWNPGAVQRRSCRDGRALHGKPVGSLTFRPRHVTLTTYEQPVKPTSTPSATRMNETILGAGNLTINRFFALDTGPTSPARSAQDKEMLGLVSSHGPPLRRLHHLPRHPLPEEGVTDEEFHRDLRVGLVVGGSIVIPHLRRAVARLEEVREA